MDIYLAGAYPYRKDERYLSLVEKERPFTLESFAYANPEMEKRLPLFKKLLLDSGAFTMFGSKKAASIVWEEYIDKFADFINRNGVKRFFELDIDKIVGYDKVIELRRRLENKTGRQCIPVWHKSRGRDNFVRMCDEYKYVAIGGLVGAGGAGKAAYTDKVTQYFPWFIDICHARGGKIHALGFTSLIGLKKYHFDSVDSTAWCSGNQYGTFFSFENGVMKGRAKPPSKRIISIKELCYHNYSTWVEFQKYGVNHL